MALVNIDERNITVVSVEIRIQLGRIQIYAILILLFLIQKCAKILLPKSMNSASLNMNKCKCNIMSSFRKHNSSLAFRSAR